MDGNYAPAWTGSKCKYQVMGAWPEKLWKQYKLAGEQYWEYLHLSRDGIPSRKRNYEAHEAWRKDSEMDAAIAARTKRIRSDPEVYQPFARVPEAEVWLNVFKREIMRYPILMVYAPSYSGKTEWAESLFNNPKKLIMGKLTQFPDAARTLDRTC